MTVKGKHDFWYRHAHVSERKHEPSQCRC